MNHWIKVLAVALPIAAGVGYWSFVDRAESDAGSTEEKGSALTQPLHSEGRELLVSDETQVLGRVERESPVEPVKIALPAVKENPLPPLLPLPSDLNDSDTSALAVLAELSPSMVQWLVPQEQVRKWVLAIDLLADGKLPQRHRPLAFSVPAFQVEPAEGKGGLVEAGNERYLAVSRNEQRFNDLVQTLSVIDSRTAGRYYQAWLPMLEQAYGELGKKGSFNQRMIKAVDNVLVAKPMRGDGVLKQPHVLYEFESAMLEQSSGLDKALWRLGDENRQTVQTFLKELKFYL